MFVDLNSGLFSHIFPTIHFAINQSWFVIANRSVADSNRNFLSIVTIDSIVSFTTVIDSRLETKLEISTQCASLNTRHFFQICRYFIPLNYVLHQWSWCKLISESNRSVIVSISHLHNTNTNILYLLSLNIKEESLPL